MNKKKLIRCWHVEVIGRDKKFSSWRLVRRAAKHGGRNFVFWFRIAQFLYGQRSRFLTSFAKSINRRLIKKYGVEIMLGVQIDEGLWVGHPVGIVVNSECIIGKNFTIRQNTTIGTTVTNPDSRLPIVIGDNVSIGANSCIVGNGLRIGNNVTIGAMSFVNKDVPSDCTYITVKESRIDSKATAQ